MRDVRAPALLIGFVPFLYVAAKIVPALPPWEIPGTIAAFAGTVALAVYYLWGRWYARVVAPFGFLGLLLLFLVTASDPSILYGVAAEVTVGVLLAGPLAVLLVFAAADRGPGARIVGLQLALLQGLAMLAAQLYVSGSNLSMTSGRLVTGYLDSIHLQISGLETLIAAGSPGPLPLAAVNDATFVALAGFAILFSIVSIIRPVTGREVDLPVAPGAAPGGPATGEDVPGLPPSFRAALASRSTVEGPPRGEFPGLLALATGIAAALAFLALIYTVPSWTLLLTGVASMGGISAVVATIFRPLGRGKKQPSTEPKRESPQSRPEGTSES